MSESDADYLARKRYQRTRLWTETNKRNRKERLVRVRRLLREIKSRPCMDCGGTFDPVCMDFDHRDPNTKSHGIAHMAVANGTASILAEIEKCDVVCANCHRLRTSKRMDHLCKQPEKRASVANPHQMLLGIEDK